MTRYDSQWRVVERVVNHFFFLMIRRPPRSTLDRSSAASDVYKRQIVNSVEGSENIFVEPVTGMPQIIIDYNRAAIAQYLSLIHISEPTRPY